MHGLVFQIRAAFDYQLVEMTSGCEEMESFTSIVQIFIRTDFSYFFAFHWIVQFGYGVREEFIDHK